jgi:hypothetical protein
MTLDEARAYYDAHPEFTRPVFLGPAPQGSPVPASPAAPVPTAKRRAASHTLGVMNKTESLYADLLEARKLAHEIRDWNFEPLRFPLTDGCTFTPDFIVVMPRLHPLNPPLGGFNRLKLRANVTMGFVAALGYYEIEAVEVKACTKDGTILMRDDSLVKLKWAAKEYPWIRWRIAARLRDGDWKYREIGA